jgi:hypothetical protein
VLFPSTVTVPQTKPVGHWLSFSQVAKQTKLPAPQKRFLHSLWRPLVGSQEAPTSAFCASSAIQFRIKAVPVKFKSNAQIGWESGQVAERSHVALSGTQARTKEPFASSDFPQRRPVPQSASLLQVSSQTRRSGSQIRVLHSPG